MDKLKAYTIGFFILILAVAAVIIYKWGFLMLLRIVLSLGFFVATLAFALFSALTFYAKSWKFGSCLIIITVISAYATYLSASWQNLEIVAGIIIALVSGLTFGIWYISEPGLGFLERFKSAENLERIGNYKAAARNYEKKRDYLKVAEMYEKLGWMESAAWAYERAESYEKAARIYEELYEREKEAYYLKEAYECWKKAGNLDRAAKVLESYAEEKPCSWRGCGKTL